MRLALGLLVAALLFPAAVLAAPPPEPVKSDNVTYLTTLDEPNVISANFRGEYMYLSHLRGLSIYDVSTPEEPVLVGTLDLPHFQNEDVDLGGDILLISHDPNEGFGVLYVVSIADPTAPEIIGQMPTGAIDTFFLDYGTGHTASCVQDCKYAYLAGTRAGIDIVDLTDPENPKYADPKNFPADEITPDEGPSHDVQFDRSGNAWIAGYGGTAAYDISDPLRPKPRYVPPPSAKSRYAFEPANDGSTVNDFVQHNSIRLRNGSLKLPTPGGLPGEDSPYVVITEEDYTRPGCQGAGEVATWRIGLDNVLSVIDRWRVEVDSQNAPPSPDSAVCSAHYFDERGGLLVQGWYEQGARFLDVSDPFDIREVGWWIPAKNAMWGAYFAPTDPTGQTVYALDNSRGVDVIHIDRGAPPPGGTSSSGTGSSGTGSSSGSDSSSSASSSGSGSSSGASSGSGSGGSGSGSSGGSGSGGSSGTGSTGTDGSGSGSAGTGLGGSGAGTATGPVTFGPDGPRGNVGLDLDSPYTRVRRRQRLTYRLTVTNGSDAEVRDVRVKVPLPRALLYRSGGAYDRRSRTATFTARTMPPRTSRSFALHLRVRRRPATRRVTLVARLESPRDAEPRDDVASESDAVARRARRARASDFDGPTAVDASSYAVAGRFYRLAQLTARMPTMRGPVVSGSAKRIARRIGYLCRLVAG